eukprot:TRINITY_DN3664_c0_g4_i1.p1 TRINITY_DN3664_c0_g4~~TRINITY_DN3664_c0_g4_i1.p1  ORF type:complete len:232 (+),score=64.48 TRINITY_DN3664_c0_g4_i1:148-843(+)
MNHVQFEEFEECTSPAEPSRVVCGTSFVGSTGAGFGERTHTHSVFFDSDECEEEEVVVVVPAEDVAPQKPCSRTADPQRRKRRLLKVFENGRLLDDCGRAVWKSVAVPDTPTMQMDTVYGIITRSLGWHDVNRNTYRQGEDNGAVGNLWAFNGRPLVNAQDLDDGQWVVAGTAKSRFAAPLEGVRGGRSPSPPSPVSPRRSEWVARLSDPSNFTGTQRTKHAGARRVSLAA